MDNHEDKENDLNKDTGADGEPQENDIPLWLQGMGEQGSDDTKPIDPEDDDLSDWVREIEDLETEPEESNQPESSKQANANETEDETTDFPDASDDHEVTEEVNIEDIPEEPRLEEDDPSFEEFSSIEGFVEISELDMDVLAQNDHDLSDEEPLRDGDLPEWLQEMIAESSEENLIEEEPVEIAEVEDIADQQIDSLIDIQADEGLIDEVIGEEHDSPQADELTVSDFDLAYSKAIAEEDTAPIPAFTEEQAEGEGDPEASFEEISEPDLEDQIELSAQEEEQLEESAVKSSEEDDETLYDSEPVLPSVEDEIEEEPLEQVKTHLESGQIADALPMIISMVEDSTNLEELETLLKASIQSEGPVNSEIMETLGDIATKKNRPAEAFNSYAQALKILLENEEVIDEFG